MFKLPCEHKGEREIDRHMLREDRKNNLPEEGEQQVLAQNLILPPSHVEKCCVLRANFFLDIWTFHNKNFGLPILTLI